MLLSFAQFERGVTGERIRDKIAASKKKGLWMGGLPSLGYEVKDRKLVVVEEEAERVRLIFRRYLDLGWFGPSKDPLAQGVVSKRRVFDDGRASGGLPFSRGALYHLLQNPVYRGMIVHKDRAYVFEALPRDRRDSPSRKRALYAAQEIIGAIDAGMEGNTLDFLRPVIARAQVHADRIDVDLYAGQVVTALLPGDVRIARCVGGRVTGSEPRA